MKSNCYDKVNPRVRDPNPSLFKTSSTLVSHGKSIKYLKCEIFVNLYLSSNSRSTKKSDKLVSFMNGAKT